MKYLIIEDEPLAQIELERLLHIVDSECVITNKIDSVSEAIKWIKNDFESNIIFMDIHLSDDICFEIFNHIQITIPVVFTTAYDQYAIDAFQTMSIGYLLKPVDEQQLRSTLNKYKTLQNNYLQNNSINQLLNHFSELQNQEKQIEYKDRILAKLGDNYYYLNIDEISYIYSEDHYTFVITNNNNKYIINYTLDNIIKSLNPHYFFRISRMCIININSIKIITKHLNGRLKLSLNPEFKEEIYVSRNRVNDFLMWLDGNNSTIQ